MVIKNQIKYYVIGFFIVILSTFLHEIGHYFALHLFGYKAILKLAVVQCFEKIPRYVEIIVRLCGPLVNLFIFGITFFVMKRIKGIVVHNILCFVMFSNYMIFAAVFVTVFLPNMDLNCVFKDSNIIIQLIIFCIGILLYVRIYNLIPESNSDGKYEKNMFVFYIIALGTSALISKFPIVLALSLSGIPFLYLRFYQEKKNA